MLTESLLRIGWLSAVGWCADYRTGWYGLKGAVRRTAEESVRQASRALRVRTRAARRRYRIAAPSHGSEPIAQAEGRHADRPMGRARSALPCTAAARMQLGLQTFDSSRPCSHGARSSAAGSADLPPPCGFGGSSRSLRSRGRSARPCVPRFRSPPGDQPETAPGVGAPGFGRWKGEGPATLFSRSPSHEARNGACSEPSASKSQRNAFGNRRIVGKSSPSLSSCRPPPTPTVGRARTRETRSASVPATISVSGLRNSTQSASTVSSPRLFAAAKPRFSSQRPARPGTRARRALRIVGRTAVTTTTTRSTSPARA